MVYFAGYDFTAYFKKETLGSSYGTEASPGGGTDYFWLGPVKSITAGRSVERVDVTGIGSRNRRFAQRAKIDDTVTIEVPVFFGGTMNGNGDFIESALDTFSDTDNALDQYTIKLKSDNDTNGYITITGCYIDQIELSTEKHQEISMKLTLSVKEIGAYGADTDSFVYETIGDTETILMWNDGKVAKTNASTGIHSAWTASNTEMEETEGWSISVSNKIKKIYGWTNEMPVAAYSEGQEVTGSLNVNLVDYVQWTELENFSFSYLDIYLTSSKYIRVDSATFDGIDIEYAELELIQYSIPFTGHSASYN